MKKMIRILLSMALIVGLLCTLGPAPAKAAEELPKRIVMGGNTPGSLFFVLAAGFSKVVSAHTPMKVEVFPEGGTVWYPMMQTGEVDFGINVPDDILLAYKGEAVYQEPTKGKGFALRTLMLGSPLQLALIVPGDSDIKGPEDIKGKRMPVDFGTFFTTAITTRALLANYGLTTDDVKGLTVTSYPAGVRAVIEGRADLVAASVGSGIVEELKAAKGARYLPLDTSPEAIARMRKIHPGYYAITAKPGPAAITEDTPVMAKDITLIAPKRLSDDVAYHITKALWENYEELAPVHPQLKNWTPDRFVSSRAVVPYHPGAVKLYKEKGVWTGELEEHQKQLMAQE